MNESQIIQAVADFLQRTDLKGGEVPAFNVCMQWLEAQAKKLNTEGETDPEE